MNTQSTVAVLMAIAVGVWMVVASRIVPDQQSPSQLRFDKLEVRE